MKKFIGVILTCVMTLALCTNVYATQVITFEDDGASKVTDSAKQQETSAETDTKESTDEKADENKKETTTDDAIRAALGIESEDNKAMTGEVKGYLALGQDLSSDQLATVLGLMGVNQADLGNYSIVYTTNTEEHESLDKYIPSSVIGTKSLSSVLVVPKDKGNGVVVTTKNINYCTNNMYRNALITAGVQDADIIVAAPSSISGTAALIGALKAYSQFSGKAVDENALDTSLDELVTTGQISESVDDAEAEEFISYVKAQVASNDLDTDEEIEAVIRKGMEDYNVTLTEEEIRQIIDLMKKIKAMGIDYNVLLDQADDIYAKYKDQIDAGTFDIRDVSIEDLGLGEVIKKTVTGMFEGIGNTMKEFFGSLFG